MANNAGSNSGAVPGHVHPPRTSKLVVKESKMKIVFKDYLGHTIGIDGFTLTARDAFDTATNIRGIFVQRTGWFQKPKPILIQELKEAYKTLCPDMEVMFPGVVDKMMRPEIVRQLGFIVDGNGNVSCPA